MGLKYIRTAVRLNYTLQCSEFVDSDGLVYKQRKSPKPLRLTAETNPSESTNLFNFQ
jgi:hypothetical protein